MQITTTLNRIKVFEDCDPVLKKLLIHLGKKQADDDPVPFSTILDACGLAQTILCCKAEPRHNNLWRHYATDCLETVRHLMGSRSTDVLEAERCSYIGKETGIDRSNQKNRAFGAAHGAYLTALCANMAGDPNHEYKKSRESAAIGVCALTQGNYEVAIEGAIEVTESKKLRALTKHFRRIVDAGWVPLLLSEECEHQDLPHKSER